MYPLILGLQSQRIKLIGFNSIDTILEILMTINNLIIVAESGTNTTRTLSGAVTAATSGMDILVTPGTYEEGTITVPTGINIIGTSSNCVINSNIVLEGTASCTGVYINTGYYIEQDGVKYYG